VGNSTASSYRTSTSANVVDHWPPQLYVRETRRLQGAKVFTQGMAEAPPQWGNMSVGLGSYTFDSHPCQRFACRNGSDPRCAGAKPPWLKPGEVRRLHYTPWVKPLYSADYTIRIPLSTAVHTLGTIQYTHALHVHCRWKLERSHGLRAMCSYQYAPHMKSRPG
jgi:hypothetical protein